MNSYKIIDDQEIYSNKTEFVPIFRVKQWLEYNKPFEEIERLNNIISELEIYLLNHISKREQEKETLGQCIVYKTLSLTLEKLQELKQEN